MGAINLTYIKDRRKALKITQDDAAEALGLGGKASYNRYETGKADFKADHLAVLCGLLNCNIDDLFKDGALPGKSIEEMLDTIKSIWRESTGDGQNET